jgi:hypothetical protein
VILLSARSRADAGKTLRTAAQVYGANTDSVALKVKQEFAAKEKAGKAAKPAGRVEMWKRAEGSHGIYASFGIKIIEDSLCH